MATVALFHSALGVRPGIEDAADLLRSRGHEVRVVDQYDGRTFDDYEEAMAFVNEIGFPALMNKAIELTEGLPSGFVTLGFSNGGGMAEHVAVNRPGVAGVVLVAGALDPAAIGARWPRRVPAQVHYTVDDPFRDQRGIDAVLSAVASAGAEAESFDYPGSGHLFADPSKPDEYQSAEAKLMWDRIEAFLGRVGA